MKAALFYGGPDIRVEQVPDPVPGPGEVLVRVQAAGICGSDLHGYRNPAASLHAGPGPRLSGHELAGVVAVLGAGVTGLSVGQRVGVEPRHLVGCGHCRWCRRGDYHLIKQNIETNRSIGMQTFAQSLETRIAEGLLPDSLLYQG